MPRRIRRPRLARLAALASSHRHERCSVSLPAAERLCSCFLTTLHTRSRWPYQGCARCATSHPPTSPRTPSRPRIAALASSHRHERCSVSLPAAERLCSCFLTTLHTRSRWPYQGWAGCATSHPSPSPRTPSRPRELTPA